MPKTRNNPSGYREFYDEKEGRNVLVHRRVVENDIGGKIAPGMEVHHINGDKQDNRHRNLIPLEPEVHDRIHHEDPDACFYCGRSGHWAKDCYAHTTVAGNPVRDELDDEDDDFEDDDEDDYEDDDDY
jgi:hypothetical protein